MRETEWRRLRADELRARAAEGAVAILPLAAMEQHGPHLPVDVDSVLGEAVAGAVARRLEAGGCPALCLPVFWSGISAHHLSLGGTLSIDHAAFTAAVEALCRNLVRQDFRRIFLLNAHGGNDTAVRWLTEALTPALGVPILGCTYWHAAATPIRALLTSQDALLHACEAETALMLHLRPQDVRMDLAPPASPDEAPEPGIMRWRTIASRSPCGVIGNPRAATPELGARLLDAIADTLAAQLGRPGFWDTAWGGDAS